MHNLAILFEQWPEELPETEFSITESFTAQSPQAHEVADEIRGAGVIEIELRRVANSSLSIH
jgi:hypothetical protein